MTAWRIRVLSASHEAPYCGIPQIPLMLQKIRSIQYLCQPCKQKVLARFPQLGVLNQHNQEALLFRASYF